jgi:hypothetical protein
MLNKKITKNQKTIDNFNENNSEESKMKKEFLEKNKFEYLWDFED